MMGHKFRQNSNIKKQQLQDFRFNEHTKLQFKVGSSTNKESKELQDTLQARQLPTTPPPRKQQRDNSKTFKQSWHRRTTK